MLKLRLSNLICLTTYLRILFLFDNSISIFLAQVYHACQVNEETPFEFLIQAIVTQVMTPLATFLISLRQPYHNLEKVGFAITFLCMYHARI